MSNLTTTNNDLGNSIFKDAQFRDADITFSAPGTLLEGTILALDSVTQKYVPFVKGGTTNGDGIPRAILVNEIVVTIAGDVNYRVAISGSYRRERLIIAADGDGSNIDNNVLADLQSNSLIAIAVEELNVLDNQ